MNKLISKFNVCLTIAIALQNFLRNRKIVRIIYFPIIFSDKINIKINIYIYFGITYSGSTRAKHDVRDVCVTMSRATV